EKWSIHRLLTAPPDLFNQQLRLIATMDLSDKDTIETAALGRPFQLGMLYDCRKDALIQVIPH
ncbi:hypothetical protein INR49_024705, partial [Caranx melampygus]